MTGIGRELWGALIGNGGEFSGGQRQRTIAQLEPDCDLSHAEAELRVDRQQGEATEGARI